jgi:hypothetical protein
MGHVWTKIGNIPSRPGMPKLLAELTIRKRREEELTGKRREEELTGKRRDEELKGKRTAWGDPGRGRPFHPACRSPPAAVSSDRPLDLGFEGGLTAVDGRVFDHMGSEEDGKRKNMAGNGGRERGRGGAGQCRCRRCSMSRGAPRQSLKSERARFYFFTRKGKRASVSVGFGG